MVDGNGTSAGNSHQIVSAAVRATVSCRKLRINPNNEVRPDNYEDLQLDFPNPVYKNLEKYLPPDMLVSNREERVRFMTDIMLSHLPSGERSKVKFKALTFFLSEFEDGYCFGADPHCFYDDLS